MGDEVDAMAEALDEADADLTRAQERIAELEAALQEANETAARLRATLYEARAAINDLGRICFGYDIGPTITEAAS
jgi:chromosome segregation ATPase